MRANWWYSKILRHFSMMGLMVIQFQPVSAEQIRCNGNHIVGLRELPSAVLAIVKLRVGFAYHAFRRDGLRGVFMEIFGDPVGAALREQIISRGTSIENTDLDCAEALLYGTKSGTAQNDSDLLLYGRIAFRFPVEGRF